MGAENITNNVRCINMGEGGSRNCVWEGLQNPFALDLGPESVNISFRSEFNFSCVGKFN